MFLSFLCMRQPCGKYGEYDLRVHLCAQPLDGSFGQPRNHYRLYACTHTSRFTPEEKGHLETLQPQEICFAETGISLTKDEYSTLYTTGHTLEITFSYGDESVTVRGNTRTGIFEAI